MRSELIDNSKVITVADFYQSRIPYLPDPKSSNNNTTGREKKLVFLAFFVATNFTKWIIMLFLNRNKKLSEFTKNYSTFYQDSCH